MFVNENHFKNMIENLLRIEKSSFLDIFESLMLPWEDI
jgi:hypothetical protein